MDKLSDLVEIADDAISSGVYVLNVKVCDILAIAESFREMERRAEAAEDKLAENEKSSGFWGRAAASEAIRANKAEAKLAGLEKQKPLLKCSTHTRAAPAADLAELVPDDTKRMDWLCAHCVEVRDPQMYGSHAMFHAQQDSEEWDLPFHTTLREQIDEAMRNIEDKKNV